MTCATRRRSRKRTRAALLLPRSANPPLSLSLLTRRSWLLHPIPPCPDHQIPALLEKNYPALANGWSASRPTLIYLAAGVPWGPRGYYAASLPEVTPPRPLPAPYLRGLLSAAQLNRPIVPVDGWLWDACGEQRPTSPRGSPFVASSHMARDSFSVGDGD
eukprot:1185582-Prorocentrum_minimum.AAC.2